MNDYAENPTRYVSQYGANYFHEDIADTFAVFVLGGEPKGDTVAAEKVRFFWEDADMVACARPSGSAWGWSGRRATPPPTLPPNCRRRRLSLIWRSSRRS